MNSIGQSIGVVKNVERRKMRLHRIFGERPRSSASSAVTFSPPSARRLPLTREGMTSIRFAIHTQVEEPLV